MKLFNKTFALMMALVLIVALFSGTAMAAKKPSKSRQNDTVFKTMTPGTWYEVKLSQKFMLNLKKDSIVSVKVKNSDDEYPLALYVYSDKGMNKRAGELGTRSSPQKLAFRKGTYYVDISGDHWVGFDSEISEKNMGKVMIKVSNINDKKNYCPARAVSLKNNKKYTCAATPMNLYSGFWFKIKTTRKQNITIYSSDEFDYSSDCSIISMDFKTDYSMNRYDSTTYRSWNKLPAGTYYLVIGAPRRESMYAARTRTIWWK